MIVGFGRGGAIRYRRGFIGEKRSQFKISPLLAWDVKVDFRTVETEVMGEKRDVQRQPDGSPGRGGDTNRHAI